MTASKVKVSIIGGGLSALQSYWGCLDAGYSYEEVEILYTAKENPVGAIFMYEAPISWVPTPVTSILLGTCEGYAINQWGHIRPTSVNQRFKEGNQPIIVEQLYIFDEMRSTLWGMIPKKYHIAPMDADKLEKLKQERDAVIATFASQDSKEIYRDLGFLVNLPVHVNAFTSSKHMVFYNGLKSVPWVRQTILSNRIYTEYAIHTPPSDIMRYETDRDNKGGEVTYSMDLHPDCQALSWEKRIEGNLLRVGRFACFMPGYLSHTARRETKRFLEEL